MVKKSQLNGKPSIQARNQTANMVLMGTAKPSLSHSSR